MKGVHGILWEFTGFHGSSPYMMEVRLGIYSNVLALCDILVYTRDPHKHGFGVTDS
jgi:hypothetical protein